MRLVFQAAKSTPRSRTTAFSKSSQLRLGISPGLNLKLSLREKKSQTVGLNRRNQPLKFNPLDIHAAVD